MLGAEELRIGNLVEVGGTTVTVLEIDSIDKEDQSIMFAPRINDEESCTINAVEPITLTEEWLLRFGFDYKEGCYLHNHETAWESLTGSLKEGKLHFYGNSGGIGQPLKYVHQLQNLYHALTGEELQLKD